MTNPWRRASTRLAAAAVSALAAAAAITATVVAAPSHPQVQLQSNVAPAGATLKGAGTGFSPAGDQVEIHFNAPAGPTLWSGAPAASSAIAFSFKVPNVSPGGYRIVATQDDQSGAPIAGTPVTAPFGVAATTPAPTATPNTPPKPNQTQPAVQQPAISQPAAASTTGSNAPLAVSNAPAGAVGQSAGQPDANQSTAAGPAAPSTTSTKPATVPAPTGGETHPPQVNSLWRVGGAVPQVSPTLAPISPAGGDTPVLLLAIDATAMTGAIVVIALALQPQPKSKAKAKAKMAKAAPVPAAPRRRYTFSDW